jgi:hypothetical protein
MEDASRAHRKIVGNGRVGINLPGWEDAKEELKGIFQKRTQYLHCLTCGKNKQSKSMGKLVEILITKRVRCIIEHVIEFDNDFVVIMNTWDEKGKMAIDTANANAHTVGILMWWVHGPSCRDHWSSPLLDLNRMFSKGVVC